MVGQRGVKNPSQKAIGLGDQLRDRSKGFGPQRGGEDWDSRLWTSRRRLGLGREVVLREQLSIR